MHEALPVIWTGDGGAMFIERVTGRLTAQL